MGVNLPAHLVIIKNTQQYVNGAYQVCSFWKLNILIKTQESISLAQKDLAGFLSGSLLVEFGCKCFILEKLHCLVIY